jgi:hypothetical protein
MTNELFAALSKAQAEFKPVVKNRRVKVRMKDGSTYEFIYADLATCRESVIEALCKYGLSIVQPIQYYSKTAYLTTVLAHSSGQKIISRLPLNILGSREITKPQELGSLISYYRRYEFCSILGIVGDEDDDANIAAGNSVQKQPPKNNQQKPANHTKSQTNQNVASEKQQQQPQAPPPPTKEAGLENNAPYTRDAKSDPASWDFELCPTGQGLGKSFTTGDKYKHIGKAIKASQVSPEDLDNYIVWLKSTKKDNDPKAQDWISRAEDYLESIGFYTIPNVGGIDKNEDVPF